MSNTVQVDDLASEIIKQMSEYKNLVSSDLKDIIIKNGKDGVETLRQTSPKASKGKHKGRYSKGWKATKQKETSNSITVVIHNKTDYQLAHLLEFGHAIVKGGRTVGSARAIPHIEKVQEQLDKQIERDIRWELSK